MAQFLARLARIDHPGNMAVIRRHEPARPVCGRLLDVVGPQAAYPPDFVMTRNEADAWERDMAARGFAVNVVTQRRQDAPPIEQLQDHAAAEDHADAA